MSETAACRSVLAQFCKEPLGIDIGAGGDKIVPHAWAFDLPVPYTSVGGDRQQLRGLAQDLGFICDGALDWVYSAHLIEDYSYRDLLHVITEWKRILKVGGLLVLNAPDQQKFLAHCQATGQGLNLAHKEPDFSLDNFKNIVVRLVGGFEEVFVQPEGGAYSWYIVLKKVQE